MSWLSRLLSNRADVSSLDTALRETLTQWHMLPAPDLNKSHFETRYVVVNTEATGANVARDRLLSVAAIAINRELVVSAESLYASLEPDPATALTNLLSFVGNDPVVVFNSAFNRKMLEHAFSQQLGIDPEWTWIDLYWILGTLFPVMPAYGTRLAEWMRVLDIETFQRHHALGDAFAVAQLMLAVQSKARARGIYTPRSLSELEQKIRRDAAQ